MRNIKTILNHPLALLVLEIIIPIVTGMIIFVAIPATIPKLNFELFGQTIVTLNSGIIIAIFIALFHSKNKDIESFRGNKRAARQMYKIFLVNCIIVSVIFLAVNNTDGEVGLPNQSLINTICCMISLSVTLVNVKLVNDLLTISTRR